jgi:plasmid replication initiation protein
MSLAESSGVSPRMKYHTTPIGIRLVYTSADIFKNNPSSDSELSFSTKDFYKILKAKSSGKYDKMKKLCKELLESYASQKTANGWKMIPLFNSVEYVESEEKVIVQFHDSISDYLRSMNKAINSEESINSVVSFKSKYSLPIYEMCKHNIENTGEIKELVIDLQDFKSNLGIEDGEYIKFNDFKRKVMLQAQKEINEKSEINLEFDEIKEARKVISIKLITKYKAESADAEISSDIATEDDMEKTK